MQRNGVTYHFVADGRGPDLRSWQRCEPVERTAVERCRGIVDGGGTAVLHLNGLMYGWQARQIRRRLPASVAIVAQHHAERPPSGVRRLYIGRGLRAVDGFFFTARQQATPWVDDGLILPSQPIFEIMEGSTAFRRQTRDVARAETGLRGEPVFLWVGRLIDLKDPLTVLRGFDDVLLSFPNARLYMAYGSNELLQPVEHQISSSKTLSRTVTLLGSVPHQDLEAIFNSADYFVLGSHSEGSGYALAEALACGVVPIVTDIPSFRRMTNNGQIGALWQPGNPTSFAAAVQRTLTHFWPEQSAAASSFFDAQLSFAAIGQQAMTAYRDLAAQRQS